MLKKIFVIGGAILILLFVWFTFQSVKNALTTNTKSESSFFGADFFFPFPSDIMQSISFQDTNRVAQVSLEELGEFSPAQGLVEIEENTAHISVSDVNDEYIIIRALETNVQPVNISNWSLQSMVSDEWIGLPQGAPLYILGEVNEVQDIYLAPGERAIISTSQSPVGVSFRVNRCSGFLNDTQDFDPPIRTACINPQEILLPTAQNIKDYGASCVSFVERIGSCTYVTSDLKEILDVSQACKDFIKPLLTYNYCINTHAGDADFYEKNEWRIFLNEDKALWRENYEIVRLLDEKHRTVDVITY
ncbi:hypothetical protein JXR01_02505 [Candidatus Kaiserbacteria bacterium]|nr:MAG: hypothetical protein JXR01_02505 [Candidatus Kaiserbacteria bacterium]